MQTPMTTNSLDNLTAPMSVSIEPAWAGPAIDITLSTPGPQGPKGDQGVAGPAGPLPDVSVLTLDAGYF